MKRTLRLAPVLLLAAGLAAFPLAVQAGDHGGGAPEPVKLTVNLGDPNREGRYLQVEMVFEAAPEVLQTVSAYRPKVLHELILILSSAEVAQLLTLKGKHELADHIVEGVNKVIHEKPKTGVQEVLFTNFIIQ